jgi:hypothetical protein
MKSSSCRSHVVICFIGIQLAIDIILSAICSAHISNENIATVFHCLVATFSATFNTNDVLPIAGLAANIISSQGLNHQDILSNLVYHERVTFSFNISGFSAIL